MNLIVSTSHEVQRKLKLTNLVRNQILYVTYILDLTPEPIVKVLMLQELTKIWKPTRHIGMINKS